MRALSGGGTRELQDNLEGGGSGRGDRRGETKTVELVLKMVEGEHGGDTTALSGEDEGVGEEEAGSLGGREESGAGNGGYVVLVLIEDEVVMVVVAVEWIENTAEDTMETDSDEDE